MAKIIDFLQKKVGPYLIILFGSAARGRLRPDSDIDIAFLSDRILNEEDLFFYAVELAEILGRDVDLIDLNKASTVFKAQIVGKGKVIHSSDDLRRMAFAMSAFKEYAVLNEERQYVLDQFKERGLNYAE
ncbi:MAG: type VII toxin-antitoxin system MntA family adenylyltransferase antitoxin [Bacteroidota bacterium]